MLQLQVTAIILLIQLHMKKGHVNIQPDWLIKILKKGEHRAQNAKLCSLILLERKI